MWKEEEEDIALFAMNGEARSLFPGREDRITVTLYCRPNNQAEMLATLCYLLIKRAEVEALVIACCCAAEAWCWWWWVALAVQGSSF